MCAWPEPRVEPIESDAGALQKVGFGTGLRDKRFPAIAKGAVYRLKGR
jgi:hypothetical protein